MRHFLRVFLTEYIKLPYQLELPFDGKHMTCPVCNPSGDPKTDFFRSMCPRHYREYDAAFDSEKFQKAMDEAMEEGRRAREEFLKNQPSIRINPGLRFR